MEPPGEEVDINKKRSLAEIVGAQDSAAKKVKLFEEKNRQKAANVGISFNLSPYPGIGGVVKQRY